MSERIFWILCAIVELWVAAYVIHLMAGSSWYIIPTYITSCVIIITTLVQALKD